MPRVVARQHNASAVRKNLTASPFTSMSREWQDSVPSLSRGEEMWCSTAMSEATRQTRYPTEESTRTAASEFGAATLLLQDLQRASLDANQAD